MKFLNAVLLNDTEGRSNIGCNLTSKNLKKILIDCYAKRQILLSIESCPYLFGKNKEDLTILWRNKANFFGDYTESNLLNNLFLDWLKNLSLIEYGYAGFVKAVNADIVFFQPEGTLGENSSFQKVLSFFSLALYCLLIGKKVVCLNGTVPDCEGNAKIFLEYFFKSCSYASFRDKISADIWGGDFLPDAAFGYSSIMSHEKKDFVLITTGARNSKNEDEKIISSALDFCREKKLKPLVLTKDSKNFVEFKDEVLKMGGVFKEKDTLPNVEKLLRKCILHIGGRYHMAIFCLVLGVPSVLYGIKTHKNEWLDKEFSDIKLFNNTFDIFELANSYIENRFNIGEMSSEVISIRDKLFLGIDKIPQKIKTPSSYDIIHLFR